MKICPLFVAGITMANVEDKQLKRVIDSNWRARIVDCKEPRDGFLITWTAYVETSLNFETLLHILTEV